MLQQTVIERPPTSKPRDPDSYDFKDEQLAKDYRKMYERFQQMENLMKQQNMAMPNPDDEDQDDDDD